MELYRSGYFTVLCAIAMWQLSPRYATCLGAFELRLVSYRNERASDALGRCCESHADISGTDRRCPGSCHTSFRICLKQYQSHIDPDPPCYYGSRVTDPVRGNSIDFHARQEYDEPLRFPFSFAWPGTFSIIVEAWQNDNTSLAVDHVTPPGTNGTGKRLIMRMAEQRSVAVGTAWVPETHTDAGVQLELQYRVLCEEFYFGDQCMEYCRGRDDQYGHHACAANGTKRCLPGWEGPYCNKPVCRAGCDGLHGYCERPGECVCRLGYYGDNCERCQLYPGCLHGSCLQPFECTCEEGWGGLFCNQDLNYCTHYNPCGNGATCTNTGAGHYTCQCLPGFTGTNCEIKIEDCSLSPCRNGASCREQGHNYTCTCVEGFSGRHCQVSARSCAENPCENRATCIDTAGGYMCLCAPGWEGSNCDTERDECQSDPCRNGGRCIDDFDGFKCVCPVGFNGTQCEDNVNDCSQTTCLNGGKCIDLVNRFNCECPPGFTGSLCQHNVDDCMKRPCANGGTCFDLVNDYRCMCRPGFKGKDCSIDINECDSSPCRNGGTCEDVVDDYTCTCSPCFVGKNCQTRNDDCEYRHTFQPWLSPPDVTARSVLTSRDGGTEVASASATSDRWMQQLALYVSVPVSIVLVIVAIALVLVVVWICRRQPLGAKPLPPPHSGNAENQNRYNTRLDMVHNELRLQAAQVAVKTINEDRGPKCHDGDWPPTKPASMSTNNNLYVAAAATAAKLDLWSSDSGTNLPCECSACSCALASDKAAQDDVKLDSNVLRPHLHSAASQRQRHYHAPRESQPPPQRQCDADTSSPEEYRPPSSATSGADSTPARTVSSLSTSLALDVV